MQIFSSAFCTKFYITLFITLVFAASGNAQHMATPQTLDDLPISDILKLVDEEVAAGEILNPAGYKYVGEYTNEASRAYIKTWSMNCTCNKRGDVV